MDLARTLGCAAIALLCGACGWQDRRCDYLDDGYAPLEGNLWRLETIPLEQVPDSVVGEIQKCWAGHPYVGPRYPIRLWEARRAPSGRYYVLFEPMGISDVMLVFLVDPEGKVIEGYQYGML